MDQSTAALITAVSAAVVAILTVLLTKGSPALKAMLDFFGKRSKEEQEVEARKQETLEKLRVGGYEKVIVLMNEQMVKTDKTVAEQKGEIKTLTAQCLQLTLDHKQCVTESAAMRAEIAELRASVKRPKLLVAHIATNDKGEIVEWSPSAEILFGWLKKEVLGESAEIIVPPELRARHHAKFKLAAKQREVDVSEEMATQFRNSEGIHKTGSRIPISIVLSSGMISGQTIFYAEISER